MVRRIFEDHVVTFGARLLASLVFLFFFIMEMGGNIGLAQNQPAGSPERPATPPSSPQQPAAPAGIPERRAPSPSSRQQSAQPAGVSNGPISPPSSSPGPAPAPAQIPERRFNPPPRSSGSGEMVSLNFNRADLVEVIHVLAQHLKLTYTIDPDVKGTVTIYSAEPLRREDLLPIFHQVLRMNGAVAVKTGNLYRIMPIKEGKGLARPLGQNNEDSYAIQVVPVRFFSVAEMKKLLTPFLSPGGEIIDYPRGNFLIIVDLPSNIQRLVEVRDLMDVNVFAGTRMELYQPKVASADELATEMTKIMQSYASSESQAEGFGAQFLAIPRINQLLIISYSEAAWTYVKRWLDRIDVVAEGPGRRIFVYPVENGKATDLADTLNQALGQATTARREPSRTLEQLHRSTPPSGPGAQGTGGYSSPSSSFGTTPQTPTSPSPMGAFAVTPAPAPPPATGGALPSSAPRPPAPGQPPAAKPEELLRIVADPATNSLIVYGTAQEFQNIKNILKELDIVPRQVLLDVLITEVTLTGSQSLGVEYEILERINPTIFGQSFGSAGAVRSLGTLFPAAPSSGNSQFGSGVSGIIGEGSRVKAFINALMKDSRVKVLSSPSILAADNRPARIQVGSQEPVATGSVSTPISTGGVIGGTGFASSATIQYQNTGRIVTIIPQVNSKGLVNLQILAEVSQINTANSVTIGTAGSFPSFDIRQAETTAVVQDGDTLVIGGIIAENKERDRSGIPYLMDIPFLGRFFGTTSDSISRTELIMLITPHVIRNSNEAQDVTQEFKDKVGTIKSELERMKTQRPPQPQP